VSDGWVGNAYAGRRGCYVRADALGARYGRQDERRDPCWRWLAIDAVDLYRRAEVSGSGGDVRPWAATQDVKAGDAVPSTAVTQPGDSLHAASFERFVGADVIEKCRSRL